MATYHHHHHSPAEAAAAALDAADGVRDGRFYGNPIIVEKAPYGPNSRVVSQRTYLEPAPRVEPFGATYVSEGPPGPGLAPRVVHTRYHDIPPQATYVEQPPVRIGRSFAYEPTRVVRDFAPAPTYVRGPSPVEYLDLADASPRVIRQPPLRRSVVRSAYEDAPVVVDSSPTSVVYDPPFYTEAAPTVVPSPHHRHRHPHHPHHHSPTHSIVVDGGRHPYETDAPIVVSQGGEVYDPRVHPLERGDLPVDARPVDVLFKKSKKLVDVPITRKVKVPTVEERLVPTTRKQRVPTTKLVQEQTFKWVDEPYTDFEEREVTQMKEIWVKKLVPEKVVQKVPVKRSRKVKVPTTVTREIETVEEVEVPTTALVKVPAFRVDEIYETAQAEVETVQKIELVPRVVEEWDEEGRLIEGPHRKVERIIGQVTYDPREPLLSEVDSESSSDSLLPSTPGHVALAPSSHHHSHRRRHRHPHNHETPSVPASTPGRQVRRRIGFTLQSSSTGLIVRNVEPGSPAEFARVEAGDVVRSVNGVPVNTNGEFQNAVSRADAITLEYWSQRHGRSFSKRISLIE